MQQQVELNFNVTFLGLKRSISEKKSLSPNRMLEDKRLSSIKKIVKEAQNCLTSLTDGISSRFFFLHSKHWEGLPFFWWSSFDGVGHLHKKKREFYFQLATKTFHDHSPREFNAGRNPWWMVYADPWRNSRRWENGMLKKKLRTIWYLANFQLELQ